jgi:mercuric ion transport protein
VTRSILRVRPADSAGVIGAIIAALCCAGTPLIVGALSAMGLSFLRKDAILWPVMLVSLAVALWGFWGGFRRSGKTGPFVLSIAGAASLASGVILVHGVPARQIIYGGGLALVGARVWNVAARGA